MSETEATAAQRPGGRSRLALIANSALLLAFPVLIQLLLHPVLLGSPLRTWALYWLYTYLGVILPGTLLLLASVDRRADWLTWLGLGWVIGHALELISLLLARQIGHPGLFGLWIPVAYAIALTRRRGWERKLEPLPHPRRAACGLVLLFVVGAATYFTLNVAELTSAPPYISDVWFHVNNAHEFRDHFPMQDPRLAGESFNYHVHGYAVGAAASIATGEAILPILVGYSGMSCVFLLTLGLFNVGRAFGAGSITAGVLTALLVIFPIDFFELFLSPEFSFNATLPLYGVYRSTTTLAGHVYLSGLLMLIYWSHRGLRARDHWLMLLLAFAGAGSKAMFGPVVICGALGLAGWKLVATRSFDLRAWATAGVLCAGVLPAILPLLLGEDSYSTSIAWTYASFARDAPYFERLTEIAPWWLAASLWIFGFTLVLLTGAVAATRFKRESAPDSSFVIFAWMCFLASVVPALGMALHGATELFFLYYGGAVLAVIAGFGLLQLSRRILGSRRVGWVAMGLPLLYIGLHLGLNLPFSFSIANPETNDLWVRAVWLQRAGIPSGVADADSGRASLGIYGTRLVISDDTRRGLEWAREHLPEDSVFVVNVDEASAYAGYSERRAFLETTRFHVLSHRSIWKEIHEHFRTRRDLARRWKRGQRGLLGSMQRAGITHLFMDQVNGFPAETVGEPVFESPDFVIYAVPPSE